MTSLLVALLSVGVPALVAFGSSSRRQLGLIREEVRTLEELDPASVAARHMREQIDTSASRYRTTSWNRARTNFRVRAYAALLLMYWGAGVSGVIIVSGPDSEFLNSLLTTDKQRGIAMLIGLVSVIAGSLIFVSATYQRRTMRELRPRPEKSPEINGPSV